MPSPFPVLPAVVDAGTVALFRFNEAAATDALVDEVAGVSVPAFGSPTVQTGIVGGARGTAPNKYFQGPCGETARLALAGDMTLRCWLKLTNFPGLFSQIAALSNHDTWAGSLFRLYVNGNRKALIDWETGTPGAGNIIAALESTVAMPDNAWNRLAVRRKLVGATYDVAFFVNGAPAGSFTGQAAPSGGQAGCEWLMSRADYFNGNPWEGLRDEMVIDGRALTDEEIFLDYANIPAAAVPPANSAPTITNLSPGSGQPLGRYDPISFVVEDADGPETLGLVAVGIRYAGAWELAYDGTDFAPNFSGSTRAEQEDGASFTIVRTGGWPGAPTLWVAAVDDAGGEYA